MRLPRECYQMQQVIETHLPHLSQPQLAGLALWVCGAILAGSACQNAVASALSARGNWNSLRQYLREWLYDGSDRARPCRTELDVSLCFAPLLRWVLAWWRSGHLALAVDPTLKGDQTERGPDHRHRRQRGLPGLRYSRGLEHPPGHPARLLDGSHGGTASGTGASSSSRNDRDSAVRPGHSQSEVVETDTGSRVASLHEVSEKHHFLCPGRPQAAGAGLRPPARYGLDRSGYRFRHRRRQTPLHPAGDLVRRAGGAVGHIDRPSSGGGRAQLVRPALLDRTGLQGPQEPGLEVGQDQANGPGARLPPLARALGGHAACLGLWHQGGRRP